MNDEFGDIEVVVRLVDGRLKYGVLLPSDNQDGYQFIATSKYKTFLDTNDQELIENLPSYWVTSIHQH